MEAGSGGQEMEASELHRDQSHDILQQILSEDDDGAAFLQSLGVQDAHVQKIIPTSISQAAAAETAKRGNYKLIDYKKKLTHKSRAQTHAQKKQAVLLPKPLARVSQRISSPKTQTEAGLPTCIAVGKSIAVGFSHGQVFVFSLQQELTCILGSSATLDELGSVTAVDICTDTTVDWIAVGHQNGQVVIWDVATQAIIKTVADMHSAPVVHVRFLGDYSQLISGDVRGEVYQTTLSYRLMYYSVDTLKILGGANGTIFAIAPLYRETVEHPADSIGLLAVTSPKATFILSLKPSMKVVFKVPCPEGVDPSRDLPYLTWKPAFTSSTLRNNRQVTRIMDPVLAIAWGKTVQLVQAVGPTVAGDPLEFVNLGAQYNADTSITGMLWLGNQSLVFVTAADQLRVLDPFALTELENLDVRSMELVYHTRFSPMNSSASAKLCSFHHSLRTGPGCLYLLGLKRLYCSTIMSWQEQVDILTLEGRWIDALALCLEFYQGNGKAVVGLPKDLQRLREVTSKKMEEILVEHVEKELTPGTDEKLVQLLGSVSIDYCVAVGRCSAVLYDILYPLFKDAGHSKIFLELLEPFILNDRLQYLNPAIMTAFVEHYRSMGKLLVVEQCIVHLDILSLDFHSVVKLCMQQSLTSALIYVYTKALNDYVTPFNDLLTMLAAAADDDSRKRIGYKLMLFIQYSFEGKAFPSGDQLPADIQCWVQAQMMFLCFGQGEDKCRDVLLPLMAVDVDAFTKVLAAAFTATCFAEGNVAKQFLAAQRPSWLTVPTVPGGIPTHQQVSKLLVEVVIDQTQHPCFEEVVHSDRWPFSAEQQAAVLRFLALFFAVNVVDVDDDVLERILGHLTLCKDKSSAKEREDLLLDIVRSCSTKRYAEERVMLLSEGQSFVRVSEIFYMRRKQYGKAIAAYCSSETQSSLVFPFIRRELDNPYTLPQDKDVIKSGVLEHLTDLVRIDSEATSKIVIEYLLKEHKMVLSKLKQHPQLQYSYLRTLMLPTSDIEELMEQSGIAITTDMRETYVKLLCQFDPSLVCPFLLQNTDYRLDYCLSVCEHYNVVDATAYLLERTGDVSGALTLILTAFNTKLGALTHLAESPGTSPQLETELAGMEGDVAGVLEMVIQLCQRNSQRLVDQENLHLWFQLLDALVLPIQKLKARLNRRAGFDARTRAAAAGTPVGLVLAVLTEFLRKVLQSMMGYVPLRCIMEKIVRDHGAAQFNDFKSIILTLLDTYNYEKNILATAKKLFEGDVYQETKKKVSVLSLPSYPSHKTCGVCHRGFRTVHNVSRPNEEAVVGLFSCGHVFHGACLASGPYQDQCPSCMGIVNEYEEAPTEALEPVPLTREERARDKLKRLQAFDSKPKRAQGAYALSLLPANMPAYEHRAPPPPPPGQQPFTGSIASSLTSGPVQAATPARSSPPSGQRQAPPQPRQQARPQQSSASGQTVEADVAADGKEKKKKRKKWKSKATKVAYYLA